jgi:hypothetical protein
MTAEQVLEKQCPLTGAYVHLRIIYEIGAGKSCPVDITPAFVECLQGDCPPANKRCESCLLNVDLGI